MSPTTSCLFPAAGYTVVFDLDADVDFEPLSATVTAPDPAHAIAVASAHVAAFEKAMTQTTGDTSEGALLDYDDEPTRLQPYAVFAGRLAPAEYSAVDGPRQAFTVVSGYSDGRAYVSHVTDRCFARAFFKGHSDAPRIFLFPGHHRNLMPDMGA